MSSIKIDSAKCIHCGACVKDCITYSLEQDESGLAKIAKNGESNCISCQHCFAICPVGAISFDNNNPEDANNVKFANANDILEHIKSRRSIRQYKNEEISDELLSKLKEMLPYIPTGCNYNGLHFSIIESKSAMDTIREYVRKKLLKLISNKITKNYIFTIFKCFFIFCKFPSIFIRYFI